jgi:hypothetical protein
MVCHDRAKVDAALRQVHRHVTHPDPAVNDEGGQRSAAGGFPALKLHCDRVLTRNNWATQHPQLDH